MERFFVPACERLGTDAFEADMEAGERYIRSCNVWNYNHLSLGLTIRYDPLKWLKVTGIYDYTLNACPDKRVAHLARYSTKKRVRWKNFRRAVHIVGCILEEEGVYW